MSNFQNGVTSSQLSPQAYRNSYQNVDFQETYSVAGTQSNTTKQALLSTVPGILTVDDGSNNQVLGVASVASTSVQPVSSAQSSNNYTAVALVVLVVSVALALYFFRKYKKAPVEVEEQQSEDEE